MRFRSGCLLALALTSGQSLAYYKDTHYLLTYMIARDAGYTQEQAARIATVAQAVDDSAATEPVQGAYLIPTETAYAARADFHAFPLSETLWEQQVPPQLTNLWKLGITTMNPGVFVHALQDRYSHYGFAAAWGHWNPLYKPFGYYTDYLTAPGLQPSERDWTMVEDLYSHLTNYFTQVPGVYQKPRGDAGTAEFFAAKIEDANPMPSSIDPQNYSAAVTAAKTVLSSYVDTLPAAEACTLQRYGTRGALWMGDATNFQLWQKAIYKFQFTPNAAGLTPFPLTVQAFSYDTWDYLRRKQAYQASPAYTLGQAGQTPEILLPVGSNTVLFGSPAWAPAASSAIFNFNPNRMFLWGLSTKSLSGRGDHTFNISFADFSCSSDGLFLSLNTHFQGFKPQFPAADFSATISTTNHFIQFMSEATSGQDAHLKGLKGGGFTIDRAPVSVDGFRTFTGSFSLSLRNDGSASYTAFVNYVNPQGTPEPLEVSGTIPLMKQYEVTPIVQ